MPGFCGSSRGVFAPGSGFSGASGAFGALDEVRSEPEKVLEESEPEQRGRPRPLKEQPELQEHHVLLHELKQELHDKV